MDRHIAQRSVGLAVMKRSGIKRSCDFGQSVTSQGADITPDSQATIHDAREAQRVGKGLSATDVLILLRALGKDKGVIDGGRRYKGVDVDDGIRTVSVEGQLAAKQSNVETVKRSCRARKGDLCSTP